MSSHARGRPRTAVRTGTSRRPLSNLALAGLRALRSSSTGGLTNDQLAARIGHHATNVIKSLEDRDLISWIPELSLGSEQDAGQWALSHNAMLLLRELEAPPAPACPTCGQPLPRTLE